MGQHTLNNVSLANGLIARKGTIELNKLELRRALLALTATTKPAPHNGALFDGQRAIQRQRWMAFSVGEKFMWRWVLAIAISLMATSAKADGPFGIEIGEEKDDLKIEKEINNWLYQITPPSPHKSFEHYAVSYHPDTGVCHLRAIGKEIDTEEYGKAIKSEFTKIKTLIDNIYGEGKLTDEIDTDGYWGADRDWMMSIVKGERTYGAHWDNITAIRDRSDIKFITLSVSGISEETGYLLLDYNFDNTEECDQKITRDKEEEAKRRNRVF